MKFSNVSKFVNIQKGSLGPNTPENDLKITREHPIMYQNKEICPSKLVSKIAGISRLKLNKSVPIYSLCTANREFVMMEGIPVATWAISDAISPNFPYKFNRN